MSTFSREQIAQAMRDAGFPAWTIPVGVAVSTAESGRRSDAVNNNPPIERSVGPWQINVLAHPDVTEECAADLACSTRAAFRISGGGSSWHPWGAFTNGSYQKYLDPNADTTPPSGGSTTTPVPGSTAAPAAKKPADGGVLGSGFGSAMQFVTTPSNWYRVAFVGIGAVAIVYGIKLYMHEEPKVVDSAQRTAQEV